MDLQLSFEEALCRRPAGGDGDPSRDLPDLRGQRTHAVERRARAICARARAPCAPCAATWCSRAAARVRRDGPAAAAAVRAVRGQRPGDAERDACSVRIPPASPTASGCACRARATPGAVAGRRRLLHHGAGRPHPVFRREGDDLHMVVPLPSTKRRSGAHRDPDARGRRALRVPPGTQSGQRFGCASAACRRRETAGGAIWWWKCG